jgi:HPt (histidine-containing phosphotransfer) domain-containing protein
MVNDKIVRTIKPKSNLKMRAAQPGGITREQAVSSATSKITIMKAEYAGWLRKDLEQLQIAYKSYAAQSGKELLKELSIKIHDIKGQAGTFGFPAISLVCGSLGRLIEESKNPIPLQIIKIHMDALNLITLDGVKEEFTPETKQLIESLSMMVNKFL